MSTTGSTFAVPSSEPALSQKDLLDIEEYERIVKFAEDVLAGRHPRVKLKAESGSVHSQPSAQVQNEANVAVEAKTNTKVNSKVNPQVNAQVQTEINNEVKPLLNPQVNNAPTNTTSQGVGPAKSTASTQTIIIEFHADYYKALGVSPNVSELGLKNAYTSKLNVFGPNSAQGKAMRLGSEKQKLNAETRYKLAEEAYAILGNPITRQVYDAGRK